MKWFHSSPVGGGHTWQLMSTLGIFCFPYFAMTCYQYTVVVKYEPVFIWSSICVKTVHILWCKILRVQNVLKVFRHTINSLYPVFKRTAGRQRTHWVAKYSQECMNRRPDYFVTNYSLAHHIYFGQWKYLWGHLSLSCSLVFGVAIVTQLSLSSLS